MHTIEDFFCEQIAFIRRHVDPTGLSVIEFGAQHGKHSIALLDAGATSALAVEGRWANIEGAVNPYPEKLTFLCLDVRRMANLGQGALGMFDIGTVLGLLYHLDRPVKFLEEQLGIIKEHLFIWTHIVEKQETVLDGYGGAYWSDAGVTKSCALEPLQAFWLTWPELGRCLGNNHFQVVEMDEMPTPASPAYKAVMVYARRVGHAA